MPNQGPALSGAPIQPNAGPSPVSSSRLGPGIDLRLASRCGLSCRYQWRVSHASQPTALTRTIHNAIPGGPVIGGLSDTASTCTRAKRPGGGRGLTASPTLRLALVDTPDRPDAEERPSPLQKEKLLRQLLADEEGNGEAVEGVAGAEEKDEEPDSLRRFTEC